MTKYVDYVHYSICYEDWKGFVSEFKIVLTTQGIMDCCFFGHKPENKVQDERC